MVTSQCGVPATVSACISLSKYYVPIPACQQSFVCCFWVILLLTKLGQCCAATILLNTKLSSRFSFNILTLAVAVFNCRVLHTRTLTDTRCFIFLKQRAGYLILSQRHRFCSLILFRIRQLFHYCYLFARDTART